jgi:HEAT repeat protein
MKIEPRFHQMLLEKLRDDETEVRFKAVAMVREMGLASYFEPRLIELTSDLNSRVAASATAALGVASDNQATVDSLKAAMEYPDDRVRANAVESLSQMGRAGEARDLLLTMAKGRGNRSRANALKALMEMPAVDALPAMVSMLMDPDPRHRISALWVVERLELARLGHGVGKLARFDTDPAVKRRALRVLRKLVQSEVRT